MERARPQLITVAEERPFLPPAPSLHRKQFVAKGWQRPVNKATFPKKLDPKDSVNPSPHVLKAIQRGFRPPYGFEMFADRLFALRARQYSEEWWKERSSSEVLIAHNQDRVPIGGPDSKWGEKHLCKQDNKWLGLLEEAWEHLGTEENRARAFVLLDDASSEARQRKTRGRGYWKQTKLDRERKQKVLQDKRAGVEKQGAELISTLDDYLAATKAIASYACKQLSFVTSPEALWQAATAEFENPGEITACIKELCGVMARLHSINDYDSAPKGKGRRGAEKLEALDATIDALDLIFQQKLQTLYQAEKYTHCLIYVAGIWPNSTQKSLTGTIHRIRNQRKLATQ